MSGWVPDPVRREFAALEAMKVQLRINVSDAEYECRHNHLPFDRNKSPDCDCWAPAATAALAIRVQEVQDFSDA